jgi:glyoxylase-like metal-dependent hydrolase (beta-lactamase superfamily II)
VAFTNTSHGNQPGEINMKRQLYAASIAVVAAAALAACSPKAEEAAAPAAEPAAPAAAVITPVAESADVKPFTIGAFQAAALRDGALSVPNDNKVLAINKTKKDTSELLAANSLSPDTIDLSVQPLLVKTEGKVLLFDAGAAALFGPTAGKLPASLAAAGVDPASVTDVFISHAHGDHIGGLAANNTLAFPNASIHVQAAEWASLKGQTDMAAIVAVITPKVVEFQPGADIVPGVKAVDIKGHTPGHSGYLITSGDQSVLYIGDTMHHSVISVQKPDWTIAFDGDASTAQASRKEVIETSAANGQRIYAVHFPFPGIGKFEKLNDTYVWMAE